MNKKVFISMLCLSISFILVSYILKIFFPEIFLIAVTNENVVIAGNYIDSHKWLYYIVMFCIGMLSDYLYFGAVCKKFKISYILLIIMIVYNLILEALYTFVPNFVSTYTNIIIAVSTCYMILVPLFFSKDIKSLAITYSVNCMAQILSLSIRGLPLLLINVNTLNTLILSLDAYIWLFICLLIFTYKNKEEKKMGMIKPFYGKSKKFYEKKKAKSLEAIQENQEIVKFCDEELAKIDEK